MFAALAPHLERILLKLNGVEPRGDGWRALCPAHADRNPSLDVDLADDGRVLLICRSQRCAVDQIVTTIGLTQADLFPDHGRRNGQVPGRRKKPVNKPAVTLEQALSACSRIGRVEGHWIFAGANGLPVLLTVRIKPADSPKTYRQLHAVGGLWAWGGSDGALPLLRLQELLAASADEPVLVFEGEHKADLAASFGWTATTSAGGSGAPHRTDWSAVAGRRVVVLPDADDAGAAYATAVVDLARATHAASVRVLRLPGLQAGSGGDLVDWVAMKQGEGLDRDEIAQELAMLIEATMDDTSASPKDQQRQTDNRDRNGEPLLLRMSDVEPQEIDWLWSKRVPTGRLTLVSGPPGVGKTYLSHDMAARVSTGRAWPDGSCCTLGSVVLVSCEDDPGDTIRPRLDACGADVGRVHVLAGVHKIDPRKQKDSITAFTLADLEPLDRALQQIGDVRLVVIDPIGSYFGTDRDSNTDTDVRSLLAPLAALARKYRVAILLVAHTRKSAGMTADETVLGSRGFTGLARAVHHVARDPGDRNRRLFLPGKCNITVEQRGLGYRLIGHPIPAVHWDGQRVDVSADEVFGQQAKAGGTREPKGATADWLRDLLRPGPVEAGAVKAAATAAGIVWRTVQDSAAAIGVRRTKRGFGSSGWLWSLSEGEPDGMDHDVPSGDDTVTGHQGGAREGP